MEKVNSRLENELKAKDTKISEITNLLEHKTAALASMEARCKETQGKLEKSQLDLAEMVKSLEEASKQLKESQQEVKEAWLKLEKSEKVKKTLLLTRQLKFVALSQMRIVQILGQGSNGIVFLVEVNLQHEIIQLALKMILNFNQISTSKLSSIFQNEYEVLYKIKDIHPNIVHILADFAAEPTQAMINAADESVRPLLMREHAVLGQVPCTTQFFVIEYHPTTLKDALSKKKPSAEEIYKYATELLSCYCFLFENHVVHRDTKLDNILVSFDGSLILSDFGESVIVDDNHCCSLHSLRGGNMMFTAPEVFNQINISSGSTNIDFTKQYSWEVGCLLYQIIFEAHPFPQYPIGYGRAPNVSVSAPTFKETDLNPSFVRLIAKLLLNSEYRISITQAQEELCQILKQ